MVGAPSTMWATATVHVCSNDGLVSVPYFRHACVACWAWLGVRWGAGWVIFACGITRRSYLSSAFTALILFVPVFEFLDQLFDKLSLRVGQGGYIDGSNIITIRKALR